MYVCMFAYFSSLMDIFCILVCISACNKDEYATQIKFEFYAKLSINSSFVTIEFI